MPGEKVVPQQTIYIRKDDMPIWKSLKNKSEFLSLALNNMGREKELNKNIVHQLVDEELENYRTNYADDGFQFRRYNGQIQVNKPPSRDWAGVEVLNY